MTKYSATEIFHYPDGVVLPGQTIDLTADQASRGLSTGALVVTPEPPAAPKAAPAAQPKE